MTAPYIVWNPEGEAPPKVSYATHQEALHVAWYSAKLHPGSRFFVMTRHGPGALVGPAQAIEAGTGQTEGLDPKGESAVPAGDAPE